MQKHHVALSANDREHLQEMVKQTSLSVQVWQRAQGLLALDAGFGCWLWMLAALCKVWLGIWACAT